MYNKMTPRYSQAKTTSLDTRRETGEVVMWCTKCERALDDDEIVDGESVRRTRGGLASGGYWHRGRFGHAVEPRHA